MFNYWAFEFTGEFSSAIEGFNSLQVHVVNCVITWIDYLLSAEAVYYKSAIWSILFGTVFNIWIIIFEAAGWENENGEPYIYRVSDWSEGWEGPLTIYFISALLLCIWSSLAACIKDLTYKRVERRQRDMNSMASGMEDAEEPTPDSTENNTAGAEVLVSVWVCQNDTRMEPDIQIVPSTESELVISMRSIQMVSPLLYVFVSVLLKKSIWVFLMMNLYLNIGFVWWQCVCVWQLNIQVLCNSKSVLIASNPIVVSNECKTLWLFCLPHSKQSIWQLCQVVKLDFKWQQDVIGQNLVKQSVRKSLRNSRTLNTSRRARRILPWILPGLLDHVLSYNVLLLFAI